MFLFKEVYSTLFIYQFYFVYCSIVYRLVKFKMETNISIIGPHNAFSAIPSRVFYITYISSCCYYNPLRTP